MLHVLMLCIFMCELMQGSNNNEHNNNSSSINNNQNQINNAYFITQYQQGNPTDTNSVYRNPYQLTPDTIQSNNLYTNSSDTIQSNNLYTNSSVQESNYFYQGISTNTYDYNVSDPLIQKVGEIESTLKNLRDDIISINKMTMRNKICNEQLNKLYLATDIKLNRSNDQLAVLNHKLNQSDIATTENRGHILINASNIQQLNENFLILNKNIIDSGLQQENIILSKQVANLEKENKEKSSIIKTLENSVQKLMDRVLKLENNENKSETKLKNHIKLNNNKRKNDSEEEIFSPKKRKLDPKN